MTNFLYDYADGGESSVLYPDRARECVKCEAIYRGLRCHGCMPKVAHSSPNRELSDLFALVMDTGTIA